MINTSALLTALNLVAPRRFASILLAAAATVAVQASAVAGTVTLRASQVNDALDIEAAINLATSFGTVPGTVILDGSTGIFRFDDNTDQTINLSVSDLTFKGIKKAVLENCDSAIFFFNETPIQNIVIEHLTFRCFGDAIGTGRPALKRNVAVRHLVIEAGLGGIAAAGAVNWTIVNNRISAAKRDTRSAITLFFGKNVTIRNNRLSGTNGVQITLDPSQFPGEFSRHNKVVDNIINVANVGVLLELGASKNIIARNRIISRGALAGIFLEQTTSNNLVKSNRVVSKGPVQTPTVVDLGVNNRVLRNEP
jgi:hypothetical protein